ncbi:hypothetical protein PMAYCL1PPCAC_18270, partial [Pristionchus mayeri]
DTTGGGGGGKHRLVHSFQMEYTIPFNAHSLAAHIVDSLRETTDAPLRDCVKGAAETCRWLKQHVKSDELNAVLNVLGGFEVDEVNCKDARDLRSLTASITRLCTEKEELSSFARDVSTDLMEQVDAFCEILKKTDPKVVKHALEDVSVAKGLSEVFIKEQSEEVAASLAEGMIALCGHSPSIASFLVESPLLMNVASRLENYRVQNISEYHTSLLSLIAAVVSSDYPPPIDIILYLNKNLCHKLWILASTGYDGALTTLSQVYRWRIDGLEEDEGVIQALEHHPIPNIGAKLVALILRDPDQHLLGLLEGIFARKELVNAIFYKNDICVLMHICSELLLNEDNVTLKRSIFLLFIAAGKNGFTDSQAEMALQRCERNHSLVEEAITAMKGL